MRKERIAFLAALLIAAATAGSAVRTERSIVYKYQLDSATYIYCVTGPALTGPGRVKTTGSSATVAAVAGLSDPFTNVAVGDELNFSPSMGTRVVTARASATSITVDSAISLTDTAGYTFTYTHPTCGTAATNGWFMPGPGTHTLTIVYRQGDLTGGVDFSVETRNRSTLGLPIQVLTGTVAATTTLVNGTTIVLGETTSEFRVGLKYNTADTSDVTTNAEQIDVILSSEVPTER